MCKHVLKVRPPDLLQKHETLNTNYLVLKKGCCNLFCQLQHEAWLEYQEAPLEPEISVQQNVEQRESKFNHKQMSNT